MMAKPTQLLKTKKFKPKGKKEDDEHKKRSKTPSKTLEFTPKTNKNDRRV